MKMPANDERPASLRQRLPSDGDCLHLAIVLLEELLDQRVRRDLLREVADPHRACRQV